MGDEQHEQGLSAASRRSGLLFPVAALALAVLVGIGWLALRPDSSTESLPVATPSVPEASESPPTFAGTASITFNFDARRSMPHQTARFEVQRTNDDLAFTVSFGGKNGRTSAPGVVGDTTVEHAWWYSPDKYLEVALVPGIARNVTSLDAGSIQVAYLASVDLAVVTIEHDPKRATDEFFWTDFSGAVRNNAGATLTSATVVAGTSPITVFEDFGVGVWGYFNGTVRVVEPIARESIRTLKVISVAESTDLSDLRRLSWLVLLPDGATDPDVKADPPTGSEPRSITWGSAALGTPGRLAIAGYTENAKKAQTGIRSISYTDASGRRHTVKP